MVFIYYDDRIYVCQCWRWYSSEEKKHSSIMFCSYIWRGKPAAPHNGSFSVIEPVREIAHGRDSADKPRNSLKASLQEKSNAFLVLLVDLFSCHQYFVLTVAAAWTSSAVEASRPHRDSTPIILPWHFEVMDVSETSGILCETRDICTLLYVQTMCF